MGMAVFEQDKIPLPLWQKSQLCCGAHGTRSCVVLANCTHETLLLYQGPGVIFIPFPAVGERIYTSFGQCQALNHL